MLFIEKFEKKVFRDAVHGYINVPIVFVKYLIDTELFQRLRNVEQTGMRVLFPSARHDRFIHSLGTFHLGKKAFKAFKENIYKSYHKEYYLFENLNEDYIWAKLEALFLIACLLHDCGHSPFSHTFEYLLDEVHLDSKIMEVYDGDGFKDDYLKVDGTTGNRTENPKPHELSSAIYVKKFYSANVRHVMQALFDNTLEKDDENEDLEFIARMIIGCKYDDLTDKKNQIKNCLIELLNSKSIDVDGLDYIVRDSKLSGIDNFAIDIDRLVNSLTVVELRRYNSILLDSKNVDLIILDGDLKDGLLNGQIAGMLDVKNFNGTIKNRLNIQGHGKVVSDFLFEGTVKYGTSFYDRGKAIAPSNITDFEVNTQASSELILEEASFLSYADTNMQVCMKDRCSSIDFNQVYIKGNLTGRFSGTILGNEIKDNECDLKQIQLAFHKSSLSVLQNVIYARNYEYLWIYAHHKVAYYTNYLLVELLYITADFMSQDHPGLSKDEIVRKLLAMHGDSQDIGDRLYYLSNDSDILGLYKNYYLKVKERLAKEQDNPQFIKYNRLYQELFSRKFKISAWKSSGEFNMFFSDLTDKEKLNLKDKLLDQTISDVSCNYNYGYFNGEWKEKFDALGMNDTMWVDPKVKLKQLDIDNTFILFKDMHKRLSDFLINRNDLLDCQYNGSFFYIYYNKSADTSRINIEQLLSFLKEEAKKTVDYKLSKD